MASAQDEFNDLMRDKSHRRIHPDDDVDSDDARSFLNLSDDSDDDHTTPAASHLDAEDDDEDIIAPRASSNYSRSTIPLTRYEANTGPKGVISDAQNFRDSRRSRRISLKSSSTLQSQIHSSHHEHGRRMSTSQILSEKLDEDEDEDELDEVEDAAFMREWRQSRLKQLQNGGGSTSSRMHQRERSRRFYGGLVTVDGTGYLDAVEKSPGGTVVVVFIYDDYSHVSHAIESCIRTLAQKHMDTRFVKLHFEDAEMEPAGVPALLAYQGGEKFAQLVPIIQEIPDDADLSAQTLEVVLRR